ncbi:MAG TPA: tRNA lysidine(34) synthetase TilS [Candidatus Marinimicrobia bacterium]|nr:tRNA lysidine(34) synthetase TilS [Candidatus Neomarinimicrobiota bacterium]
MVQLLENKLSDYCKELDIPLQELSILHSFSGGIDSTVLASLLIELKEKYGFKLSLMHFNHNADLNAKIRENFCNSFSIKNKVDYHNKDLFINHSENFESSSREKRYSELNAITAKINSHIICTAHHLDDQIETLFMKMLDNSDWISKIGIREKLDKIRRPLLSVRKDEIRQIAIERNLSWVEDPSNNDLSFRRNNVRKSFLPDAIKADPKLESTLLNESHASQVKMNSYISEFNNNKFNIKYSKQFISVNLEKIKYFEIEKLKIFIYWFSSNYLQIDIPEKSRNYWIEFSKYLQNSKTGSIYNLGPLTCILNREEILFISDYLQLLEEPIKTELTPNKKWFNTLFTIKNCNSPVFSKDRNEFSFTENVLKDGLYLRRWRKGDKILTSTSAQHILLSNLFINNKISKLGKLIQPVVVDKMDNIVWVPGLAHAKLPGDFTCNHRKVVKWIPA